MNPSNFQFLAAEWPEIFEAASKSEKFVYDDARTSCFYARRALELGVRWIYTHDAELTLPYQEHLAALIHEPKFRDMVGSAVFTKAKLIKDLGNIAVHTTRPIRQYDALTAAKELFHVMFWQARTYARKSKPADTLTFKQEFLSETPVRHDSIRDLAPPAKTAQPTEPAPRSESLAKIQKLEADLKAKDESLADVLTKKLETDAELQRLRKEIAEAKKANTSHKDNHDYSEAETRRLFIDLLLREAGWPLDQERDREFEVEGMSNNEGKGFVDYVLWGNDGIRRAIHTARFPASPLNSNTQVLL